MHMRNVENTMQWVRRRVDAPAGVWAALILLIVAMMAATGWWVVSRAEQESQSIVHGLGVIAAATLAGLWIVYRYTSRRWRTMTMIRDALLAMGRGESAPAALEVDERLGEAASAWNALVRQQQSFREQAVGERASEAMGERRDGAGDLDKACDAMSQGLILIDHQLRVKYANGAAGVLLQAGEQRIVGREITSVFTDEQVLAAVRQCVNSQVRHRVTYELARGEHEHTKEGEDGAREGGGGGSGGIIRVNVRPLRREDQAQAMVILEDVTQQRAAESARQAFVAQTTHELRTPLTNIRLYVETALEEGDDPATRTTSLNVINQESRRLERIVTEMLSMAEIEAGQLSVCRDDVRLEELFTDLGQDYEATAREKRIDWRVDLPPKLPVLQADREKLGSALHNLVGNALKYTPEQGSVSVNVETDERELRVKVADTGIGVREEDRERIFEKFSRAEDPRLTNITGSGLGLAMAREIVRMHGGEIVLESELNKGSTFIVTLPVG